MLYFWWRKLQFHKHLAWLIWECGLGAEERDLRAKKCYFSLRGWICFKKGLLLGLALTAPVPMEWKLRRFCQMMPGSQRPEDSLARTDTSEPVTELPNRLSEVTVQATGTFHQGGDPGASLGVDTGLWEHWLLADCSPQSWAVCLADFSHSDGSRFPSSDGATFTNKYLELETFASPRPTHKVKLRRDFKPRSQAIYLAFDLTTEKLFSWWLQTREKGQNVFWFAMGISWARNNLCADAFAR